VHGGGGQPRRAILGSGDEVRAGIEQVATDYHAEEVMVVTITHDHAARRRSYELIAEAFGLSGAGAAAGTATA
jgi:alkanesulfonate monooxygenase SsuD/methylene tetrahydromethanopterin reductase-like flavin-dependent oxidoreductase (luciferase family)